MGYCDCSGGGGGIPYGNAYANSPMGAATAQLGYALGQMLGQGLVDLFSSPSRGGQANYQGPSRQEIEERQRAEALRRQRAFQEELDRQARALKEAEQKWVQERDQLYATLKGPKPGPLVPKGLALQDLGIKDVQPRAQRNDLSSAMKQAYCSSYLMNKASAAADRGDQEEAKYLTNQAGLAMSGGQLTVKCPDPPAAPPISAESVISQSSPPLQQFYVSLMQTTQQDMQALQAAQQAVIDKMQRKEETEKKVQERRQRLRQLQEAMPPVSPSSIPSVGEVSAPPSPSQSDSSLVAEAQRLLQEAEAEDKDATTAVDEATKQRQTAVEALQRDKTLYDKVQANPQEAAGLLSQMPK